MNQKGFSRLILVIIAGAVLIIAGGGFWYYQQLPKENKSVSETQTTSAQKLSAHEMPKLLDIEVKSGVDKEDAGKMREGFKIMDFYLNEWLGHSITKKSAIRVEATSEDSKFLEENGTFVFLYRTGSRDWQVPKQLGSQFHTDMRSRAAAHEYVHLYQINNGCAHAPRIGEKARWFLEGEADWFSYKAFEESGAPFFFDWKKQLLFISTDLRPLQTYDDERFGSENNTYPYFVSAVDFLMKNRDIKTLNDLCVNLGKRQDVSVAFQNAFGVSFEKFRSDFEAYFTKTYSKTVKEGGTPSSGGGDQSQIPQGYSSWEEFCKVQPKDSRCAAYKP